MKEKKDYEWLSNLVIILWEKKIEYLHNTSHLFNQEFGLKIKQANKQTKKQTNKMLK